MKRKDIIYGIRPIIEAIQADKTIDKVLIQRGLGGDLMRELTMLIRQRNVPMQLVPIEKLHRMVHGNHQGAIAYVSEVDYASIFDVIPTVYESGEDPFILVLDRITDVRNLGAIVRTAECAGVHAIVIPVHNSAQINEDAVKTSAGAIHNVPICRHTNLKEVFVFLKEAGVAIIGATEKAKNMHYQADYCRPLCIVMGNEGEGISPEYFNYFTDHVKIPLMGTIDSLNVSVATGVVLYEALRHRNYNK